MKKIKDVIKFVNQTRKKNNYHWEKEGEELLQQIKSGNYNKPQLKEILSILLLTEEIPIDFVPKLWFTCAQIEENINKNKDQYKKLIKAYDILLKNKHPLYIFLDNKMSVDLNRSFNQNEVMVTNDNIIQLKNILQSFTVRNVSLNYCQGYNTIAAFFLQTTKFLEEQSYYLFIRLMEDIFPYDYYLFGIGIEAETSIINKLLEIYEPEIISHLSKNEGGDLILFSLLTQFITSLFTFKMDKNLTIFFFNCMFGFYSLEEKKENIFYYFYKIILAVFNTLKSDILKTKNDKQLNDVINVEKISKEKLQSIIYFTLFDNSKNTLDIDLAKKIRNECVNKIIERKKIQFKYNNDAGLICNINYPICLEQNEIKAKLYLNTYYTKGIDIKNKNENNNIINIENEEDNILKDIIIERREHYCQIKSIKKEYNYTWEKEGKELLAEINNINDKTDKKKFKKILSILFLKEDISNNIIPSLWESCTHLLEKINLNKGQYPKLLKAFDILIKNEHPFYIYIKNKISFDLNRTFCNNKEFQTQENIEKLKNILHAFTVRNVSLNYCQGLNSIVGYFLRTMNFSEEKAFYLYLILLEEILPYDYYLFGIGVETDINVINIMLKKYEKDLIEHLESIQADLVIFGFLTQFVTSLFTFKINLSITNTFYNILFGFFLLEDNRENLFYYFYKIILAIFRTFKDELIRLQNFKDINTVFNLEKDLSKENIEKIIYYTLFESEYDFDLDEIKKIRQNEMNKVIKNKKAKFKFDNNKKIKCNLNYPLCVEDFHEINPVELTVKYEKIESKEPKEQKEENEIENKENKEQNDDDILKDIIIERRKHFCQK